jgi:hypothetical protein
LPFRFVNPERFELQEALPCGKILSLHCVKAVGTRACAPGALLLVGRISDRVWPRSRCREDRWLTSGRRASR